MEIHFNDKPRYRISIFRISYFDFVFLYIYIYSFPLAKYYNKYFLLRCFRLGWRNLQNIFFYIRVYYYFLILFYLRFFYRHYLNNTKIPLFYLFITRKKTKQKYKTLNFPLKYCRWCFIIRIIRIVNSFIYFFISIKTI